MKAIKEVRKYLQSHPGTPDSQILSRLAAALGDEAAFPLGELYELDGEAFELAIELMRDWRLDRYYAARIKLFDAVLGGAAAGVEAEASIS
jgi:hypothetical protein